MLLSQATKWFLGQNVFFSWKILMLLHWVTSGRSSRESQQMHFYMHLLSEYVPVQGGHCKLAGHPVLHNWPVKLIQKAVIAHLSIIYCFPHKCSHAIWTFFFLKTVGKPVCMGQTKQLAAFPRYTHIFAPGSQLCHLFHEVCGSVSRKPVAINWYFNFN